VVRGSAGRGCRARVSKRWSDGAVKVAPEGVGVKGGGLMGDSDSSGAALRFLGNGVAGRDGIVKSGSVEDGMGSSFADALVLRFLGAAVLGFVATLVYFASLVIGTGTGTADVAAVLLATRAERLRDMLKYCSRLRRVMLWEV
jgi:hypothetical protein